MQITSVKDISHFDNLLSTKDKDIFDKNYIYVYVKIPNILKISPLPSKHQEVFLVIYRRKFCSAYAKVFIRDLWINIPTSSDGSWQRLVSIVRWIDTFIKDQ